MSTYPIEVVNIGFDNIDAVQGAIYFLNKNQKTFKFVLVREKRFEIYQPKETDRFLTEEIYDLMDEVFTDLKGLHNFTIGVVQKRLDGKKWGNLFGSMQTNKNGRLTGKAVTSAYGVYNLLQSVPIEIYYIFEFLSFSIRFIVKRGLIHDRERGCLFHRKVEKSDILETIRAGYISLESQQQINKYLDLEQIISFRTLLTILSEIARADNSQESFQLFLGQEIGSKLETSGFKTELETERLISLKKQLEILKKNLNRLEEQKARWGGDNNTPLYISNQIDDANDNIEKIVSEIEELERM
jgi:hypothetical protein